MSGSLSHSVCLYLSVCLCGCVCDCVSLSGSGCTFVFVSVAVAVAVAVSVCLSVCGCACVNVFAKSVAIGSMLFPPGFLRCHEQIDCARAPAPTHTHTHAHTSNVPARELEELKPSARYAMAPSKCYASASLYLDTHTCTHALARARELQSSNNPSCFSLFFFFSSWLSVLRILSFLDESK